MLEDLKRELPKLRLFVTLSPVPGFARWLAGERRDGDFLDRQSHEVLEGLSEEGWWRNQATSERLQAILAPLAAHYLTRARTPAGKPVDPVARFHLGNGARLERINWRGDLSSEGLRRSHGIMVNYLYKLEDIERNHEAYANTGEVVASNNVMRLARAVPGSAKLARSA